MGCSTNTNGDVRFDGAVANLIRVYHDGVWGTICDDVFDSNDNGCGVICRQMGYADGQEVDASGDGEIVLDNVNCSGNEARIDQCPANAWRSHNCSHGEDVGCTCSGGTEGDVRFDANVANLVRVYHNGNWGTICDDYFDRNDNGCRVVCHMMGLTGGEELSVTGNGEIVLDDVQCTGNENRLIDCPRNNLPMGQHNCSHGEDVGCVCGRAYANGDVKFDASVTNLVRVYHDGLWGTICDDVFDQNDNGCQVICRQMGLTGGQEVSVTGDGQIVLDNVSCTGAEANIASCSANAWRSHNCSHGEDVGCICG